MVLYCYQSNWNWQVASININMTPLKNAIFVEVRKNHDEANALNDDQLNKLLFHHPDGLRLSLKGFIVIKNIFTAYSFEIPETIKTRHQFGMSKMEYPYFLTKRRLVLFSEMDAMVIKIHGGIEGFLETCSQFD
jgi:dGTP triphosphohydrolase